MRGHKGLAILVGVFAFLALSAVPLATALRHSDLYSRHVKEAMSSGVSSAFGGSLSFGGFSGNPLVGYDASDFKVLDREGRLVLAAKSARFALSPWDLLMGRPRLSSVQFYSLQGDLGVMRSIKFRSKGDGRLPLDELRIVDGVISTPRGDLLIKKGRVRLPEDGYVFSLEGSLLDLGISVRGELARWGSPRREVDLDLRLGDGELSLKGVAGHDVEISGGARGLNVQDLASLLDALELEYPPLSGIRGRLWSSFDVKGRAGILAADGDGRAEDLTINNYLITSVRGAWTFSDGKLSLNLKEARMNRSLLAGRVAVTLGPRLMVHYQLSGGPLDLEAWSSTLPWLQGSKGTAKGVSVDITYSKEGLSGEVVVKGGDIRAFGEDLKAMELQARLDPRRVSLRGGALWMGAKSGFSGTLEGQTLKLSGPFSGLRLKALGQRFKVISDMSLDGTVGGRFALTHRRGSGLAITVNASSKKVGLLMEGRPLALEDLGGEFSLSGENLMIRELAFRHKNGRFLVDGAVGNLSGQGVLSLRGKFYGVPADLAMGGGSQGVLGGTFYVRGSKASPMISFLVECPSLKVGEVRARSLRASGVALRGGVVRDLSVQGVFLDVPFSLSGNLEGGVLALSGRLPGVSMEALGGFLPSGAKPGGKLNLDILLTRRDGAVKTTVGISGGVARLYGLEAVNLMGQADLSGGEWRVKSLEGDSMGGRISLSGQGCGGEYRLELKAGGISLGALGGAPGGLVRGSFSGSVRVSSGKTREVQVDGTVDSLGIAGLSLGTVGISARGQGDSMVINSMSASVGGGKMTAQGTVSLGKELSLRLSIKGKGVEMSQLLGKFRFKSFPMEGPLDMEANLSYGNGSISGGGVVTVPHLKIRGLNVEGLRLPFYYSNGYLVVEDGRGSFYGGDLRVQFSREMSSTAYGGNLWLSGFDLAKAWGDLFPGKSIKGSGRGDLALSLKGDAKRTSLNRGSGRLSLRDGKFWGFDPQFASAMGAQWVSYRDIGLSFELDGLDLYVLPGSRISSPPGDKLYRYMMFDGSLLDSGALNLNCYGNLSSRGLNAAAGMIGGLASSGLSPQGILRGVLGGAISGWASGQFRDVSFVVRGTPSNPAISNLKVYSPNRPAEAGPSGGKRKDEQKVQIKIQVSTEGSGDQMGGQIQEQVIDNLFNILVPRQGEGD